MLDAVVGELQSARVEYALVHESALMGWGMDNNAFLNCADVLLVDDEDFEKVGVGVPYDIGGFAEAEFAGVPVRLWSRASLGINGSFEVTSCARYGCEALAPELVLRKLSYSPDFRLLAEQRARLASVLFVNELTDDELALAARYVRGE